MRVDLGLATLAVLRRVGFLGGSQAKCLEGLLRGEEGEYFVEILGEIARTINKMPKTYEQDGLGDKAVVHLHYFKGGQDWYITERDSEKEQHQAFGLADFHDGFAELGYISLKEITAAGAEMDFHWTPKTLAEVRAENRAGDVALGLVD